MKKSEHLAWSMMTDVERNSLQLTLSQGLSSWEVGEILKLSHYKYLELKERSEKFFKMFTEFFNIGIESLFASDSVADPRFKDYIEACLEKRMVRKEAIYYSGDASLVVPTISRTFILKNMEKLEQSENPLDKRIRMLIMEFDRWNNWRILPRSIQQPSAYKRRNNKRDKVYITYMNKLPSYKVNAIMDIFWYSPRKERKPRYYIPLISKELFEDGYIIVPIKTDGDTIERLSKLCIYIFSEEAQADVFGYMLVRYFNNDLKATQGQKYWPEYRDAINRSLNYKQVNNINFYVDRLDMAYNDFAGHKPKKEVKHNAKRASEEDF